MVSPLVSMCTDRCDQHRGVQHQSQDIPSHVHTASTQTCCHAMSYICAEYNTLRSGFPSNFLIHTILYWQLSLLEACSVIWGWEEVMCSKGGLRGGLVLGGVGYAPQSVPSTYPLAPQIKEMLAEGAIVGPTPGTLQEMRGN